MTKKEFESLKFIQALYLVVEPSVAEDIKDRIWNLLQQEIKLAKLEQSEIDLQSVVDKQDKIEKIIRVNENEIFRKAVIDEAVLEDEEGKECLPDGKYEEGMHRVGMDLLKRIDKRLEKLNV